MNIPMTFVFLGLSGLLLFIYLLISWSRRPNLEALAAQLEPLDVNAFRNLIDRREEEFLRLRLPAREFRHIHRERMLAAADYVWAAARNSGILVRLAQSAKDDPDPAVATAAESLFKNALEVRFYVLRTVPRVYLSMLIPQISHTPDLLAESYETATRKELMLRLRRSQAPVTSTV